VSAHECGVAGSRLSHADFERVRELHLEYYERVRRVVAESRVADRVVVLSQQLSPLGMPQSR
jgi:hypothetical protein